jgi:Flp pilus assembly pilin Flp
MLIMGFSAVAVLTLAYGVHNYLRCLHDPANDAMGRAMALWIVLFWAAMGLIPALIAAVLVITRYSRLDGWMRLIGLLPSGILLALLVPFAVVLACMLAGGPLTAIKRWVGHRRKG